VLLLSALGLGFLHGLGADHLMGIAALSLSPVAGGASVQRTRAFGIAVRFAVGHAVLLGAGAALLILLGWSLPLAVERGGEMLGGSLLILLGVLALWGAAAGRVYAHSHIHSNEPAAHWHLHFGTRDRHPDAGAHSHLPTIIGAAFAISSLRALTMLAPFGESASAVSLLGLLGPVALFSVGILISMSLFGVAFAQFLTASAMLRLGRASAVVTACASIALGGYWIVAAL
jgi:nickel/cobalt transporter (NicO) family protein